eukprot:g16370.t1
MVNTNGHDLQKNGSPNGPHDPQDHINGLQAGAAGAERTTSTTSQSRINSLRVLLLVAVLAGFLFNALKASQRALIRWKHDFNSQPEVVQSFFSKMGEVLRMDEMAFWDDVVNAPYVIKEGGKELRAGFFGIGGLGEKDAGLGKKNRPAGEGTSQSRTLTMFAVGEKKAPQPHDDDKKPAPLPQQQPTQDPPDPSATSPTTREEQEQTTAATAAGAASFRLTLEVLYAVVATLCCLPAPAAAGGGIPEVKCMLTGVTMPQYVSMKRIELCLTTLRLPGTDGLEHQTEYVLVFKSIGLAFILASGIPSGSEGPFVHIVVCILALI